MISILILLIVTALSLNAEVKNTMYPNGTMKYKRTYQDGKLHGVSRAYYPSGKLKTYTTFRLLKNLIIT